MRNGASFLHPSPSHVCTFPQSAQLSFIYKQKINMENGYLPRFRGSLSYTINPVNAPLDQKLSYKNWKIIPILRTIVFTHLQSTNKCIPLTCLSSDIHACHSRLTQHCQLCHSIFVYCETKALMFYFVRLLALYRNTQVIGHVFGHNFLPLLTITQEIV